MRVVPLMCCVIVTASLTLPGNAAAAPPGSGVSGQSAESEGKTTDNQQLSREEAARRAKAEHGGRVLSVRPTDNGWRVRLLKDGQVRTVTVR